MSSRQLGRKLIDVGILADIRHMLKLNSPGIHLNLSRLVYILVY